MKISTVRTSIAGLTGLLLAMAALAQAPVVPPVPSQRIAPTQILPPPDPLANLKLLANCTGCISDGGLQITSISPTALALPSGTWLLDGNTIARSGMTLLSLANLQVGQYVIVEGTGGIDRTLRAMVIEVFDYSVTLDLSTDNYRGGLPTPLKFHLPSGATVSAVAGYFTTWMDFYGARISPYTLEGRVLPAGSRLMVALRTDPNGHVYASTVAMR
jgi:hypothetical protein